MSGLVPPIETGLAPAIENLVYHVIGNGFVTRYETMTVFALPLQIAGLLNLFKHVSPLRFLFIQGTS